MFGLFKHKDTIQQDEPLAIYPEVAEPETFDSNSLCRACSGGKGDGICSYHASKGRIMVKRAQHINKHQEAL